MTTDATTARPVSWLSDSEAEWQRHVREVARRHVAPVVAEMDRLARIDPAVLAVLFREKLMSVQVPTAYGGAGRGLFDVVTTIEELAQVDPAVAVLVDVQNALVISALLRHGTADQRRRHLPRLATGHVGAYAISEREAGSDAFAMTASVRAQPPDYRVDGRKSWTTNAREAGLFLVFCRADDGGEEAGLTAVLVPRDQPGVTVGDPIDKLGIRASSTCDLGLDGVRVSRRDVLGRPGDGAAIAVQTLNIGKIGIAAQLVGLAQGALDAAVGYARHRRQFGEPISEFQGVRFPLAALAARLRAARTLLYDTARLVDAGAAVTELSTASAMAKYVASEVAEEAASLAVEVHGGNGFTTAHPVEKLYRDAKVGKIYEGTSNMQFRTIAAGLLREATAVSVAESLVGTAL
jgi:butyryl-CoA dehydrogenase